MAKEFLSAAETVLRKHNSPLLVKDIVQKALDDRLLTSGGKTPVNTMRARLSEHIRKEKDGSIFKRIKPNLFALREWESYFEYDAGPLEKHNFDEVVVCVKQSIFQKQKRFFGFSQKCSPYINEISKKENLITLPRIEARQREDVKQLVSYVLLKHKGRVLSFTRGNYGQKESLLTGVLCIGFGGHVNIRDIDLFSTDSGLMNSAYREIAEEIKGLKISDLKVIGIINDDSSPLGYNHFACVYEAVLPSLFNIEDLSKEKSISKIRLLDNAQLWERFHEMEFWSQLLVKRYFPKPESYNPVFVKKRKIESRNNPLIVVGEIGCGKTEVVSYMADKFKVPIISTRDCIAELIGMNDFGASDRTIFQDKSLKFITSKNGVQKLAKLIAKKMKPYNDSCVLIDGIRNIETYNTLKEQFPHLNLMYIDVPRDTAFEMYKNRSMDTAADIHEFRRVRDHQVEKEITLFKTRANIYLFNGGSLNDLKKTVQKWWNESE